MANFMLVFVIYLQVEVQLEMLIFNNRLKLYEQNVRLCKCDLSLRIENTVFLLELLKKAACVVLFFCFVFFFNNVFANEQ